MVTVDKERRNYPSVLTINHLGLPPLWCGKK